MKVRAIINFNDLEKGVSRKIGNEFECSEERYLFLKSKGAVELVEENVNNGNEVAENIEGDAAQAIQDGNEELSKLAEEGKNLYNNIEEKPKKKKRKNAKAE